MKTNFDEIFLIPISAIVFGIYCFAIIFSYWGSLMPWFLWPLQPLFILITALFVAIAMFLSYFYTQNVVFTRNDYHIPTAMVAVVIISYRIFHGANMIGIVEGLLHIFIFFSIFKLDRDYLRKLIHICCVVMGGFLTISIFGFVLYLFGFPLPSFSTATGDMMYTFENYYLFLIDDRVFFMLIPRFHSVFLEPGHLGTATTFLLLTQIGHWKKWYNIILIITTLITFSLAAYVLFIMVMFASAWIRHKQFFLKAIGILALLIGVGIGAFFYEQGDNMLFSLIIERMEVDDGKIVGDNRVTESFEAVYEDYIKSDDVLFGREYKIEDFGFGNAGYRVYIYDNGLFGLLLIALFYLSLIIYCKEPRAVIVMLLIGSAAFWVRSTPLAFYYFLPLYALPNMSKDD